MTILCERCGFPADNQQKLIRHVRNGVQCPALKSRISLNDYLNKLKPLPSVEELTCQFCKIICKTIGGLKTHLRFCKHKKQQEEQTQINNNEASTSSTNSIVLPIINNEQPAQQISKKNNYVVKSNCNNCLHSFDQDIDWTNADISDNFFIECCEEKEIGIVNLFKRVHSHPNHDNLKWHNNKFIYYDGKGWLEITDKILTKHMGFLYSVLEEKWCDYNDINNQNITLGEHTIKDIEHFMYNIIVDDESVFFHCKDALFKHLDTLKNI